MSAPFTKDNPQFTVQPNPTNTTVQIDDILISDYDGKYVEQTDEQAIYTDYIINNRYESDKHIYGGGMTSPNGFNGATTALVQLDTPTLLWIADWTACRWQTPPILPSIVPQDPNWVLLDEHYEPGMLVLAQDGVTALYRISGTYIYTHLNPSAQVINNIRFTRPAWLQDVFPRTVPANLFQTGLIDGQGGGSNGATPGVPLGGNIIAG